MDDRVQALERELRTFKRFAAAVAAALAALLLVAMREARRTRFTEIDVERLNVIEKSGRVRLAIANPERMAPVTFHGKEYPGVRGGSSGGAAGMVYFNEEGTENGGYIWSGHTDKDGSYRATGFLTFDQYNQDEALTLGYNDVNGKRQAGLTIIDEPDVPLQDLIDSVMAINRVADTVERARRMQQLGRSRAERGEVRANRVFVGKDVSKTAMVSLADLKGRPRLTLSVDSLGVAKIDFLDEAGKVVDRFPAAARQ